MCGEPCDIEDIFESVGGVATGHISLEQLEAMPDAAVDGPGVCSGLGTANTMHILCEALGMAMPGNAPVRAGSARMSDAARQAGARIVAMVEEDLRPREVLTPTAFSNAVMVLLAISGSINAVRHLQGVAVEAKVDVKIHELLEKYADEIPLLCRIRPAGPGRVHQLEQHGGARAVRSDSRPSRRRFGPRIIGWSSGRARSTTPTRSSCGARRGGGQVVDFWVAFSLRWSSS